MIINVLQSVFIAEVCDLMDLNNVIERGIRHIIITNRNPIITSREDILFYNLNFNDPNDKNLFFELIESNILAKNNILIQCDKLSSGINYIVDYLVNKLNMNPNIAFNYIKHCIPEDEYDQPN